MKQIIWSFMKTYSNLLQLQSWAVGHGDKEGPAMGWKSSNEVGCLTASAVKLP